MSRLLSKKVELPHIAKMLQGLGVSAKKVVPHISRKASTSHVLCGQTTEVSAMAVYKRARWSTGQTDTYVFSKPGGDAVVGRVLCHLPAGSGEFELLPPHFAEVNWERAAELARQVFPGLPVIYEALAVRLIASVVYHFEHLNVVLVATSKVRSKSLFIGLSEDRRALFDLIVSGLPQAGQGMQATGSTPVTKFSRQLADVADNLDEANIKLDSIVHAGMSTEELGRIVKDAVSTGVATGVAAGIAAALQAGHAAVQIPPLPPVAANVLLTAPPVGQVPPIAPPVVPQMVRSYDWGDDKSHLLPQYMGVPVVPMLNAMELFFCGSNDALTGFPPLKSVAAQDFETRQQQKDYSNYAKFMGHVITVARTRNVLALDVLPVTLQQVGDVYHAVLPHLGIPEYTPGNKKRDLGKSMWTSLYTLWVTDQAERRAQALLAAQAV
jgi:hypothetical protein